MPSRVWAYAGRDRRQARGARCGRIGLLGRRHGRAVKLRPAICIRLHPVHQPGGLLAVSVGADANRTRPSGPSGRP